MFQKFIVDKEFHNSRLDRWFKVNVLNIPQSLIEKIIRKKKIKVNKKRTKTSYRVQTKDIIEVFNLTKLKSNKNDKKTNKYKPALKEKKKYDDFVIEDNDNFIVINKPPGIPVQGGTKSFRNIIDTLRHTKYFDKSKPYIVHRLDKETSGVLIIAKNREYAQLFTSLFRIRKIHKTYHAIVKGNIGIRKKILDEDLFYFEGNKKIRQKATTKVRLIKYSNGLSFLELNPITGRKHQLRKHLANIGFPIIGEKKYSNLNSAKNSKLMLHSFEIKFIITHLLYLHSVDWVIKFQNSSERSLY